MKKKHGPGQKFSDGKGFGGASQTGVKRAGRRGWRERDVARRMLRERCYERDAAREMLRERCCEREVARGMSGEWTFDVFKFNAPAS